MAANTLTCDVCGFDAARWSPTDLERTLAHSDDLVSYVVGGWADAPAEVVVSNREPIAATHELMHRLDTLASARREAESFTPMVGAIRSLHASDGGVPKRPIESATIEAGGVVGDRQGTRRHHGRPWQAICLYSTDLIAGLVEEGHPIAAGTIGENLTIDGIDWTRLRGGLTIEIGEVRLRTSSPAAPCKHIGASFTDSKFNRVDHTIRPGWARWYASVLAGGTVQPGDQLTVRA